MDWLELAAALTVFFVSHAIPVRPSVRALLVPRLGAVGYGVAYSALSIVALGWLIRAARRAPHIEIWPWAPWQSWLPLIVMVPVCVILAFALARPNPFSFGGFRDHAFDPAQPGVVQLVRHPLLVALALWAACHMVPNGDLAHLIVFGSLALFAIMGQPLIDQRKKPQMGARWTTMQAQMRARSWWAKPVDFRDGLARAGAAVALYGILIWAHPLLFGVSPLP